MRRILRPGYETCEVNATILKSLKDVVEEGLIAGEDQARRVLMRWKTEHGDNYRKLQKKTDPYDFIAYTVFLIDRSMDSYHAAPRGFEANDKAILKKMLAARTELIRALNKR